MKKYNILCGFYQEALPNKAYPGQLDLHHFVQNVMLESGYPVWYNCCTAVAPADYGKVLTATANGIVLTTPTGGSSISNLSKATSTTTNVISNSNGTGFTLSSASSTEAGLLSSALFTSITSLITSGFNSTMSVTGNGLVATPFKLVNDSASPGNSFYYGTDATGVKGWYANSSGITMATVSGSYKYIYITPSGINTIPNLSPLPLDNTEVIISVNGVREPGITVSSLGVFNINTAQVGFNIDSLDTISASYFSV